MDGTLLSVLALVPALVFAIVFHEIAHGFAALALGDPTAREQRRLSLNPLRHVDPFGTVILPGLLALAGAPVFGWAKPVPVNQQRLRNPRFGMMAVAAAGPLTNLVMATIGALAIGLLVRGGVPADASAGANLREAAADRVRAVLCASRVELVRANQRDSRSPDRAAGRMDDRALRR